MVFLSSFFAFFIYINSNSQVQFHYHWPNPKAKCYTTFCSKFPPLSKMIFMILLVRGKHFLHKNILWLIF